MTDRLSVRLAFNIDRFIIKSDDVFICHNRRRRNGKARDRHRTWKQPVDDELLTGISFWIENRNTRWLTIGQLIRMTMTSSFLFSKITQLGLCSHSFIHISFIISRFDRRRRTNKIRFHLRPMSLENGRPSTRERERERKSELYLIKSRDGSKKEERELIFH